MSGVARLGTKTVLAHKRRVLGTAFSVIIGIAFLAGTLLFTDTIKRTFDQLFADVYSNTDVYVRSADSIDMGFGQTMRGRIDESYIQKVRAVPGVTEAAGSVGGYARIIDKNGNPIGRDTNGPPTLGGSTEPGKLSPWVVDDGRLPEGAGEVAIDKGSAKEGNFALGDTVRVVSQGGSAEFKLVGIVKFGNVDSPGGASFALFELLQAQAFVGKPGLVDAVQARGDGSISQQELANRVSAALDPSVETLTGAQITKENQDDIAQNLSFFNILLTIFAVVALFVGAFIIYNAFSITVAQRKRENALLRAVGASRRQVTSLLLVEAFAVGVVASVLGFLAGILMSSALKAFMAGFGVDIPAGGLVMKPRTAVVSLIVGLVMSVGAALLPALHGSKIPPVAAMRDVAIDRSAVAKGRILAGGIVVLLAAVLIFVGLTSEPIMLAAGVPLLFIGVFVLGPVMARPVARALGRPLRRGFGVTGLLARENASRNPKRTARTAAALMVGVALVAGITVIAASVRASVRSILGEQFTGDLVVSTQSFGFGGLPWEVESRLNGLPEIQAAAGIGIGFGQVNGKDQALTVMNPVTTGQVFDLDFVAGKMTDLTDDGMLVSKARADRDHLTVGSTAQLVMIDGVARTLSVQGIYDKDELAGPVTITKKLYSQSGADKYDFSVFAMKAQGVSTADALAAVETVTKDFPSAKVQTREDYINAQAKQIDQFVNLVYGLLALAVIIAIFGIANALSLSVYERTRELGLLRAVGASRGQVRAAVRYESVITALLGAVQGIVIGVLLGYATIIALRDQGFRSFTLPVFGLLVVLLLAILAGVLAAIRPARRAARLDVLRAVTVE